MTEEYTPSPPLPLAEGEAAAIDKVISEVPAAMRRHAILFVSPRNMEDEPDTLGRLDKLIVAMLSALKKDVPEDVAEKLFDRMRAYSRAKQREDQKNDVGVMCYRLFDSMQCMVAIKEKFRGKKSRSTYSKSHATDQLKVRGLLR
jgi:hypothetical protein